MPLRDFFLLVLLLGSVPLCLRYPFYGICMWFWIAYMNPHRFTWGYAYDFPVALVVAAPTMVGAVFAEKTAQAFRMRETLILLGIWAWTSITYVHATTVPLYADHLSLAKMELIRYSKILLVTFLMVLLVYTRQRLRILLLVTAFSLGFLAVKGSLFAIRTGGEARVWGPPDSFLQDNNALALALNMLAPIFFFMAREERTRWIQRLLYVCFLASIMAVIMTYSRGGLVGLAVVLGMIMIKSRKKALGGFLLAAAALLVLTLAPPRWMERMTLFGQGVLDDSARQRLITWETGWNFVVDHPVLGGGFHALTNYDIFARYQPEELPGGFRSSGPHNIYMQFLVDHGFPGLFLFLSFLGSCLTSLWSLRSGLRHIPEMRWAVSYCHMLEASLLAYMASGAFLGLGYFDLFYQIAATTILMKVICWRELRELAARPQELATVVVAKEQPVAAGV